MSEQLPRFRYHPNPLATGAVKASDAICVCCGLSHGHIYGGPVYAVTVLDDSLCPWCIADGSASAKLGRRSPIHIRFGKLECLMG